MTDKRFNIAVMLLIFCCVTLLNLMISLGLGMMYDSSVLFYTLSGVLEAVLLVFLRVMWVRLK